MNIVGIHHSGPISSAAIIKDGVLQCATAEERFTRQKQDKDFPHNALNFCLSESETSIGDVDCFAIGWNPGENLALKYREGFSKWMRYPGEWLSAVPNHLLPGHGTIPTSSHLRFEDGANRGPTITFFDHHTCHARFAYENSGLEEAGILVVDGWSEQKVTSWFSARSGNISLLKSVTFPHSIGCLYSTLTSFLGYAPFRDEWKVMGMSAYGKPSRARGMNRLVTLLPEGSYELDLSYFDFYNFDRKPMFTAKMTELLGPPRKPDEPFEQRHFDIAAATQKLFAMIMTHTLTFLHEATGHEHVCISGGSAMNCLFNGTVVDTTPFKSCHVNFAPDDSGNSLGAAMEAARRGGYTLRCKALTSSLGLNVTDEQVGAALERYRIKAAKPNDLVAAVGRKLASNRVVGLVEGRAEFGQRALGHRSILASPRSSKMKDTINRCVKYREFYRPFAPILPEERVHDFFETTDSSDVYYMQKAFRFKREAAKLVPAVVHKDGTGRLQAVTEQREPFLYSILKEFETLKGAPVLLNTSYNTSSEPIVNTVEDAIRTFYTSGLDDLVLGKVIISKR